MNALRLLRRRLIAWKNGLGVFFYPFISKFLAVFVTFFPESIAGHRRLVAHLYRYRKNFREPMREWKEFLAHANRLFDLEPAAILDWRIPVYFSYLTQRDFEGMRGAMKRFLKVQEEEAEKRDLHRLGISISATNMFESYNVHAYLDTQVKARLLGLQPNRRITQVFKKDDIIANPVMLEYWKKYINVKSEDEIQELKPQRKFIEEDLSFTARINETPVYIEHAKSMVQKEWEKAGRGPLMEITPEDNEFGWSVLEKAGIKRGSWFVSLHVRDAGYKLGSHLADDTYDSYRNSDIDTYHLAIKAIQERGGVVIRIGDPKMKQMEPISGVFDYAHSDVRSNRMDVFLFSQCRFFVGVSSGPILNPILFGVPTIMTNFMPITGRPHASNCLYIPKLLWLNEHQRYATFSEVLTSDLGRIFTTHGYTERNIKIVDNTPEDLRDVVVEMMDILDGRMNYSHEDNALQERLGALYREHSGYGDMGKVGRSFITKSAEQGLI